MTRGRRAVREPLLEAALFAQRFGYPVERARWGGFLTFTPAAVATLIVTLRLRRERSLHGG